MNNESQIQVPDSFVALFVAAPSRKPSEAHQVIAQRYELCEDMAQMLTETARNKVMDLGVDEAQVLVRMHEGLCQGDLLGAGEPLWVARRLAELLGWELPPSLEWRRAEDIR